jgi:hypothetical protein
LVANSLSKIEVAFLEKGSSSIYKILKGLIIVERGMIGILYCVKFFNVFYDKKFLNGMLPIKTELSNLFGLLK